MRRRWGGIVIEYGVLLMLGAMLWVLLTGDWR